MSAGQRIFAECPQPLHARNRTLPAENPACGLLMVGWEMNRTSFPFGSRELPDCTHPAHMMGSFQTPADVPHELSFNFERLEMSRPGLEPGTL